MTKTITAEYGQWADAELQVERYLNRAGDGAWCEVWMKSSSGSMFAYRAGNKACVFPTAAASSTSKTSKSRARPKAQTAAAPTEANLWAGDL